MNELNPLLIVFGLACLAGGVFLVKRLKPANESSSRIMRSEAMSGLMVFLVLGTFGLGLGLVAYGLGWGQAY